MMQRRPPRFFLPGPWWQGLTLLLVALLGLLRAGPAQAASYTFRSDSFAWETAANAITWDNTCTGYPGDDDKATITLTGGFKFRFAGTDYTSVRVLTNGGLQFGADTGFFRNYSNTTLPTGAATARSGCTAGNTTNVIMAYWTDLDPSRAGSGKVTWEQKGTAPNRYLVVSWNSVYQYNTSTPYAFQIILFENGEFKYQYGNANATGSNATIGVQVNDSDSTLYAYNSGYNANGSAIRWFVPSGTPTRRAEYRFDEYSYTGRVGEVLDSSGNLNHGVRVGAATSSASGYVCRALSIPSNTTTTSAAVDTVLDVSSGIGETGSISFWYNSSAAWNSAAATLLDASTAANRPFFLTRQSNGSLRFSVSDSAGTVMTAATGALSHAAGTWRHVAVTWRLAAGAGQSSVRIYIGGLQQVAASGTTNGVIDPSLGTLFIGDNRSGVTPSNSSANSANGLIDELRVYNYEISALELASDMAPAHSCPPPLDHIEIVPSSYTASTCAGRMAGATAVPSFTVTVKACSDASCSSVMTGYTGTVNLSSSTGAGTWGLGSGPVPAGTLSNTGSGNATYTFAAGDLGVARLTFQHSLAQKVRLTSVDSLLPGTTKTTSDIGFSDNLFVWSEDASNLIHGATTNVAIAGRDHDMKVTLVRKDPATGTCSTADDYTGTRALKLWRTDSGGSWTAPGTSAPALTSIPNAKPSSSNFNLPFTAGVATFNLVTTDIGKYNLQLADENSDLTGTISGSSGDITVRPFVLIVNGILVTGSSPVVNNPNSSAIDQARFARAGDPLTVTVGAYRWSAAADTTAANRGDGVPDAGATLAQLTAGGRTPGFSTPVPLTIGAITPAGGVPGTLNNATITGFAAGQATATNLSYTEVGSFTLNESAVVQNYLGTTGIHVDAQVFNASNARNAVVGRFVPAGFALSNLTRTHRVAAACAADPGYTNLGENFQFGFTLTAQNLAGATTQNYTGTFAQLDVAAAANFNLAGIDTTAPVTRFTTAAANLALGPVGPVPGGGWAAGIANVTLQASVVRPAAPVVPYTATSFGIAPVDASGVGMLALNLDTDTTAGNDRALLGSVPLRFGRLQLHNAIGPSERNLRLTLQSQYWNGTAFIVNTNDSCTLIAANHLSFRNFRRTLTGASVASITQVSAGQGAVILNPATGQRGSTDVAINLAPGVADQSCLSGTPAAAPYAATAGANLAYLRGAWCSGTHTSDPSARATFGLFRGADSMIYQRESY